MILIFFKKINYSIIQNYLIYKIITNYIIIAKIIILLYYNK